MAILDFLKAPKKAPPHAQISELEDRLARVVAERRDLETLVENHSAKRAAMVFEIDKSEEDIIAFDREIDLARLRLERAELVEIELTERIAAARDASDRSRRAGELERAATAIEEKTKAVESAIAALASAFSELAAAVPDDLGLEKDSDYRTVGATPLDAVRAVVAAALYSSNPDLFETTPQRTRTQRPACVEKALRLHHFDGEKLTPFIPGLHGEESETMPTTVAARRILVEPLRRQAAALRASVDLAQAAE